MAKGRIYIQETEVPTDSLVPRLQAITGSNPDALLYVRGDRAINYGRVVEVMSLVSTAGFRKVSLIAESPKGASGKTASGGTTPRPIGKGGQALSTAAPVPPMSLALAEPALAGAAEVPDELPAGIGSRGMALSAVLHLVLGSLLIIGLPRLFDPPPLEEMPIAVQLVTIAPETRATHPNPNLPRPDAKPEVPVVEAPAREAGAQTPSRRNLRLSRPPLRLFHSRPTSRLHRPEAKPAATAPVRSPRSPSQRPSRSRNSRCPSLKKNPSHRANWPRSSRSRKKKSRRRRSTIRGSSTRC